MATTQTPAPRPSAEIVDVSDSADSADSADSNTHMLPPSKSTAQRGSVSFDKTVLNVLKLESHDLDIAGEHLLVVDKAKRKKSRQTCGFSFKDDFRLTIPLYHVLWADISNDRRTLTIDYAEEVSEAEVQAARVTASLHPNADHADVDEALSWAELLRARAYGMVPQRRRAYVLVNPHAGPGGAGKKWSSEVLPILKAAQMDLTVVTTSYSGQAVDLCAKLDLDRYDMVVACSGDGLPHEVFNGLGRRADAQRALRCMPVAHIPCGSGNAMSCNLYGTHRPSLAALAIVKGVVAPLDLVSITLANASETQGKRILSFLSQAVGIVAEADLGTENLRWMGGARFSYGFIKGILKHNVYPCDLAVKVEIEDKEAVRAHYTREHRNITQRRHERAKLATSSTADSSGSDDDADLLGGGSAVEESASASGSSAQGDANGNGNGLGLPPLRYGTVDDKLPDGWEYVRQDKMGNFYCGNMAYMSPDADFFSAALMNDGLMDMITVKGDIPVLKSFGMILSVEKGEFFDHEDVHYRKVAAYRLVPRDQKDGYISIDGERVPFGAFQAEVHRGLGRVIAKNEGFYENHGPANWDKVSAAERIYA